MNFKILSALIALTLIMCGGCRRDDTTPEQRRFQRIAQDAFRNTGRESPTGRHLYCVVITHELEAGCELVAEVMTGDQINALTYMTTQRCVFASREEEPDRHSPDHPLYFESSVIPLSSPESRIKIWEGTNFRSLVIKDPSGKRMEYGAVSF